MKPKEAYETTATIKASAGASPGLAGQITYTISVPSPWGGTIEMSLVRPTNISAWDMAGLDVYALPVGSTHPAIIVDKRVYWWASEIPKVVACDVGGGP